MFENPHNAQHWRIWQCTSKVKALGKASPTWFYKLQTGGVAEAKIWVSESKGLTFIKFCMRVSATRPYSKEPCQPSSDEHETDICLKAAACRMWESPPDLYSWKLHPVFRCSFSDLASRVGVAYLDEVEDLLWKHHKGKPQQIEQWQCWKGNCGCQLISHCSIDSECRQGNEHWTLQNDWFENQPIVHRCLD